MLLSNTRAKECRCRKWSNENSRVTRLSSIILRKKQPLSLEINLGSVWPYLMQGHSYDIRPRYILYGGLLFQPMSLDLMEAYRITDLRVRHFFDFFVSDQLYLKHPEVIILTTYFLTRSTLTWRRFDLGSSTRLMAKKLAPFRIWHGRSSNRRIDLW